MADVVFPITTAPGLRPGEGAGRLINCYAEKLAEGSRASHARRRVPGLRRLVTSTHAGCRGFHYHNGDLYVALSERLVRINLVAGVYIETDLGELPGDHRVTFARNNKAPVPDILCVTEDDVFVVHQSSAPTSLNDGDLPQCIAVDFLDGYFVFTIRDGRFFVSGINDTTVDALDFGKAESHPGGIYRAIAFGELLYLCGPSSIEVWQNAGNATGSPFSRAAVIPRGIVGTFAIAGNEYGFASLIFVGDDNGVYRLDGGYQPSRISTPDLDRLIEGVADKTQLDVTVSVVSGHAFATITGPDFSWVYDLSSQLWHERASYLASRWRGVCSVQAFDAWVVGDRETGDIWMLDADYMKEGTDPLVLRCVSQPVTAFPNRAIFPRVDFDVIVGQGLVTGDQPIDTDPVCFISWSDDGGNTFCTPLMRLLGRQAEHKRTISVNRTGMASSKGRVWAFEVADPVFASLLGAATDATAVSR